MRVVLVLSPHLDDAVFSIPGTILAERLGRARVIVATVFSHCGRNPNARREYEMRRNEDRAALGILGVESRWLGLADAPFRDRFYRSFRRIIFEKAPGDGKFTKQLTAVLRHLIAEIQPTRIYAPFGVGTHIDHRLTFEALNAVSRLPECWFYEERPYALIRYAVRLRMAQLGGVPGRRHKDFQEISSQGVEAEYLRSFARTKYVREYLTDPEKRAWCVHELRAQLASAAMGKSRWHSRLQPVDRESWRTGMDAIFRYRSQCPIFAGTKGSFTRQILRYSQWIVGRPSGIVERLWTTQ